ncbi:MAG: EVE domain-containing protein [Betaproteobacteria bacterium]|nr:EVE domain-containing protein [Betaproteobacteria bacterium]
MSKTSSAAQNFWLMKSEPDVFSLHDLVGRPGQRELWDGVRNYQARNFMMNEMKVGDLVLFYHSNAEPSGVAGVAEIIEPARPDPSAWDKKSEYFDPKSTPENPRWYCVTVGKPRPFKSFISLEELRQHAELKDMLVLRKGQRLSIQPVTPAEFECVVSLGMKK